MDTETYMNVEDGHTIVQAKALFVIKISQTSRLPTKNGHAPNQEGATNLSTFTVSWPGEFPCFE